MRVTEDDQGPVRNPWQATWWYTAAIGDSAICVGELLASGTENTAVGRSTSSYLSRLSFEFCKCPIQIQSEAQDSRAPDFVRKEQLGIQELFRRFPVERRRQIAGIIDLNNTRFPSYRLKDLPQGQTDFPIVLHRLPTVGGGSLPAPGNLNDFADAVRDIAKAAEDGLPGKPFSVLVHCKHGEHRSGFFVIWFLLQVVGVTFKTAMQAYSLARGIPMDRPTMHYHLLELASLREPELARRRRESLPHRNPVVRTVSAPFLAGAIITANITNTVKRADLTAHGQSLAWEEELKVALLEWFRACCPGESSPDVLDAPLPFSDKQWDKCGYWRWTVRYQDDTVEIQPCEVDPEDRPDGYDVVSEKLSRESWHDGSRGDARRCQEDYRTRDDDKSRTEWTEALEGNVQREAARYAGSRDRYACDRERSDDRRGWSRSKEDRWELGKSTGNQPRARDRANGEVTPRGFSKEDDSRQIACRTDLRQPTLRSPHEGLSSSGQLHNEAARMKDRAFFGLGIMGRSPPSGEDTLSAAARRPWSRQERGDVAGRQVVQTEQPSSMDVNYSVSHGSLSNAHPQETSISASSQREVRRIYWDDANPQRKESFSRSKDGLQDPYGVPVAWEAGTRSRPASSTIQTPERPTSVDRSKRQRFHSDGHVNARRYSDGNSYGTPDHGALPPLATELASSPTMNRSTRGSLDSQWGERLPGGSWHGGEMVGSSSKCPGYSLQRPASRGSYGSQGGVIRSPRVPEKDSTRISAVPQSRKKELSPDLARGSITSPRRPSKQIGWGYTGDEHRIASEVIDHSSHSMGWGLIQTPTIHEKTHVHPALQAPPQRRSWESGASSNEVSPFSPVSSSSVVNPVREQSQGFLVGAPWHRSRDSCVVREGGEYPPKGPRSEGWAPYQTNDSAAGGMNVGSQHIASKSHRGQGGLRVHLGHRREGLLGVAPPSAPASETPRRGMRGSPRGGRGGPHRPLAMEGVTARMSRGRWCGLRGGSRRIMDGSAAQWPSYHEWGVPQQSADVVAKGQAAWEQQLTSAMMTEPMVSIPRAIPNVGYSRSSNAMPPAAVVGPARASRPPAYHSMDARSSGDAAGMGYGSLSTGTQGGSSYEQLSRASYQRSPATGVPEPSPANLRSPMAAASRQPEGVAQQQGGGGIPVSSQSSQEIAYRPPAPWQIVKYSTADQHSITTVPTVASQGSSQRSGTLPIHDLWQQGCQEHKVQQASSPSQGQMQPTYSRPYDVESVAPQQLSRNPPTQWNSSQLMTSHHSRSSMPSKQAQVTSYVYSNTAAPPARRSSVPLGTPLSPQATDRDAYLARIHPYQSQSVSRNGSDASAATSSPAIHPQGSNHAQVSVLTAPYPMPNTKQLPQSEPYSQRYGSGYFSHQTKNEPLSSSCGYHSAEGGSAQQSHAAVADLSSISSYEDTRRKGSGSRSTTAAKDATADRARGMMPPSGSRHWSHDQQEGTRWQGGAVPLASYYSETSLSTVPADTYNPTIEPISDRSLGDETLSSNSVDLVQDQPAATGHSAACHQEPYGRITNELATPGLTGFREDCTWSKHERPRTSQDLNSPALATRSSVVNRSEFDGRDYVSVRKVFWLSFDPRTRGYQNGWSEVLRKILLAHERRDCSLCDLSQNSTFRKQELSAPCVSFTSSDGRVSLECAAAPLVYRGVDGVGKRSRLFDELPAEVEADVSRSYRDAAESKVSVFSTNYDRISEFVKTFEFLLRCHPDPSKNIAVNITTRDNIQTKVEHVLSSLGQDPKTLPFEIADKSRYQLRPAVVWVSTFGSNPFDSRGSLGGGERRYGPDGKMPPSTGSWATILCWSLIRKRPERENQRSMVGRMFTSNHDLRFNRRMTSSGDLAPWLDSWGPEMPAPATPWLAVDGRSNVLLWGRGYRMESLLRFGLVAPSVEYGKKRFSPNS